MLDDVLHNQCVQDMDVDQVMAVVVDDQVMGAEDEQIMAVVDIAEMDLLETNTKEEVVHVQHTEDKIAIPTRSGNLTLKDKD